MTERSSYHHGNLREALLAAGLDATRSAGVAGLALRDLARRVGVSPNAAYRHFADRESLLGEVARRLQGDVAARMDAELEDALASARPGGSPERAALRAVGLGYIDYALEEPGWFEVAFADTPPRDPWHLVEEPGPELLPPPLARLVTALDGL